MVILFQCENLEFETEFSRDRIVKIMLTWIKLDLHIHLMVKSFESVHAKRSLMVRFSHCKVYSYLMIEYHTWYLYNYCKNNDQFLMSNLHNVVKVIRNHFAWIDSFYSPYCSKIHAIWGDNLTWYFLMTFLLDLISNFILDSKRTLEKFLTQKSCENSQEFFIRGVSYVRFEISRLICMLKILCETILTSRERTAHELY